jgi:signal transduction histidine kinase
MRKEAWLAGALLLVVVLFAAATLGLLRSAAAVELELMEQYAGAAARAVHSERVRADALFVSRVLRIYLAAPDDELLAELRASTEVFQAAVRALERSSSPEEGERLRRILELSTAARDLATALLQGEAAGAGPHERSEAVLTQLQPLLREADSELEALIAAQREKLEVGELAAGQRVQRLVSILVLCGLAALGLMALLVLSLLRQTQRRRQAQLAAERVAAELEATLTAIPDPVLVADADGLRHANPSSLAMLRAVQPQGPLTDGTPLVNALDARDAVTGARLTRDQLPFWRALQGEEVLMDITYRDPLTGDDRTVRASAARVPGARPSAVVVLADITARRQAEETQRLLARAGQLLGSTLDANTTLSSLTRLLVDSVADACAVFVVRDGALCLLERAARDSRREPLAQALASVGELTRGPLLISSLDEAPHPRLGPSQLEALRESGANSLVAVPITSGERLLGGFLMAAAQGSPRHGANELELARGLAALTALALHNAELYGLSRRAVEARQRMMASVVHDLRNPLNGILLAAQRLDRTEQGGALAKQIVTAAQRMSRLIDDLLDVARVEAGRFSIVRSRISASEVVRAVIDAHAQAYPATKLVDALSGELPPVDADRERVHQILGNLVSNACKFTPEGGTVKVGAREQGDFVLFWVHDDGPGIAPEQQAHLFEPFWQAEGADRRGVGLGLFIVRVLVEAHGGTVEVVSSLGQGACFQFTLPVAKADR